MVVADARHRPPLGQDPLRTEDDEEDQDNDADENDEGLEDPDPDLPGVLVLPDLLRRVLGAPVGNRDALLPHLAASFLLYDFFFLQEKTSAYLSTY